MQTFKLKDQPSGAGELAHRLQRRTAWNTPLPAYNQKWLTVSGNGFTPRFLGSPANFW